MGFLGGLILKPTDQIPTAGLVAEYLANNNTLDTSGNGYNGTGTAITYGPNRHSVANSALVLNGSTSFVNIDAALAGLSTNTVGSLSFWLKMPSVTAGVQMAITFSKTATPFEVIQARVGNSPGDAKLTFLSIKNGVTQWVLTEASPRNNNTWYHIALIQDAVSPYFLVDTVRVPQSFPSSLNKTSWFNDLLNIDNGRLGSSNANGSGESNLFNGSLDDIRIYDRVLTTQEITELYNE